MSSLPPNSSAAAAQVLAAGNAEPVMRPEGPTAWAVAAAPPPGPLPSRTITRSALGPFQGPDTTGSSILNVLLGISGAVLVITLLLCAWSWMRWRRLQAAARARAAAAAAAAAAKEAHLAEEVHIVIPVLVISPGRSMHLAFDPEEDRSPEGSAVPAGGGGPSPGAAAPPGAGGSLVRTLCMRRSESLLSVATAEGSLEGGECEPFEQQESVCSLGGGAGDGASGGGGAELSAAAPAGPQAPQAASGSPGRPSSRERQHHRRWPSTVPEEAADEGAVAADAPAVQQQQLETASSKASDGSLGDGP